MKLRATKPRFMRSAHFSHGFGIWYVPGAFVFLRLPWRVVSLDWQKGARREEWENEPEENEPEGQVPIRGPIPPAGHPHD